MRNNACFCVLSDCSLRIEFDYVVEDKRTMDVVLIPVEKMPGAVSGTFKISEYANNFIEQYFALRKIGAYCTSFKLTT